MKKIFGIILVGATVCLAPAQTMTYNGTDHVGVVNISGALNGSFYAGTLKFNEAGLGSIVTVCADLYNDFSAPATWYDTKYSPVTTFPVGSYAAKHYYDASSLIRAGNITAAGFAAITSYSGSPGYTLNELGEGLQLAVWAALYNSGTTMSAIAGSSLVIGSGSGPNGFTITGFSSGAKTAANLLWASRNTAGAATFITADGAAPGYSWHGQDQLTAAGGNYPFGPVPEPFTMSLGLASVGLFVRRKLKKQTA